MRFLALCLIYCKRIATSGTVLPCFPCEKAVLCSFYKLISWDLNSCIQIWLVYHIIDLDLVHQCLVNHTNVGSFFKAKKRPDFQFHRVVWYAALCHILTLWFVWISFSVTLEQDLVSSFVYLGWIVSICLVYQPELACAMCSITTK